ncbi:MAG TPA: histidine kinase dimerization/phosphoacceptor domain -containing protein [Vicinamibacterales bacterium]|nr:histidine kinase dimerization/phosphoacceptor domain -containing protein [Vicinamibacterales bacterium]
MTSRWETKDVLPDDVPRDEHASADTAFRSLEDQRRIALAAEAEALTRLHQTSTRLWRTTELGPGLEHILDAVIALLGADLGNVQLVNPATGLLEIAAHRGFKQDFLEFFREVSIEDGTACGRSLRSGQSIMITDVEADAEYAPFRDVAAAAGYRAVHSTPLVDRDGQPLGVFSTHFRRAHALPEQDLRWLGLYVRQAVDFIERHRIDTALRASLSERDALLKELHHRVKNNLQVIMSLAEMQARQVTEPEARSALVEARNRVTAIAAIHEMLYQAGSFSRVDLGDYARRLVPQVVSLYGQDSRVKVAVSADEISIDLTRAVPFGLLLNELVSNACKHAFSTRQGELTIALTRNDGQIHLRVSDTGVGLPDQFDDRTVTTLGVQLVRMLTKQLGGTVSFTSGGGTTVDLRLPMDP